MIPSIQKNFDVWATTAGGFFKSALAPVLETVQRCLDMLAGAQAVDALVGTVAAVDGFRKRANLDAIGLPAVGMGLKGTEKNIPRRLWLNPDCFIEATPTAAFNLIGITGEPAG
jgi:hypothetical protein